MTRRRRRRRSAAPRPRRPRPPTVTQYDVRSVRPRPSARLQGRPVRRATRVWASHPPKIVLRTRSSSGGLAARTASRIPRRRPTAQAPAAARRRARCARASAAPARRRSPPRSARARRVQRAVGVEIPGVVVVGEAQLDRLEHLGAQRRILDRHRRARRGCRGCAASGRRRRCRPSTRRPARTRTRASARAGARRRRRRGCCPRAPARPGAGSRSRAR